MTLWGRVLLEWCNCLDLYKKIDDLNELRNGIFLANILRVLNKNDITTTEGKTIQTLMHLLHKTYPNLHLEHSNCTSFSELTEDELTTLASLLMHYTCIYDQRDVLTSPLCHRLSKNTQLCIKQFLEAIEVEITCSDLEQIIDKITASNDNESLHLEISNKISSPLTSIFKTPVSKMGKFYDKDREIAKIKNVLEMEQFEKEDLKEELKLQTEKTKELEILLAKSNSDISKLKKEITKLECRTPPHFQTSDSADTEKRLKKEIQSLEHYIEKVEKEQDELREQNYQYDKKISEWELKFSQIRNKYLEAEERLEDLTCLSAKQADKISALTSECDELNSLLEEFKAKPINNSSFFETSSINRRSLQSVVAEENLASSVVEIQLREAQTKNDELLMKFKYLNTELEENKRNMRIKVEEYEKKCNALYHETKKLGELKVDLTELKDCYVKELGIYNISLQQLKQAVNEVFGNYRMSIELHNTQLSMKEKHTQKLSSELSETVSVLEKCKLELHETIVEKDKCNNLIQLLQNDCRDFAQQNHELSSKLEENNKKYSFEIQSLEKTNKQYKYELDQLEKEKTEYVTRLEYLRYDYEKLTADNKDLSLNLSIKEEQNEKYSLEIQSLSEIIKEHKYELNQLKNEKTENISQIKYLKNNYEKLNADNKDLVSKLNIKEEQNNKYSSEIQQLTETIKQHKCEFDQLKNEKTENMSHIKNLENNYQKLDGVNKDLTSKLIIKEEQIVKYSSEIQSLTETIKQHKFELDQLENEKIEKMSQIENLENDIQKLNTVNKDLSSQLNIKEEYNEKYFLEIQTLTENAKQHKYELDQFENEKTESMSHIKNLECNYEKLAVENKDLYSKLNIKEEQHEKYSLEIQSLTETIKQKNYELEQYENEKTKFLSSIEHLKYEYEKLDVENKNLSSKLKIKEEENENYSLEIQSLTKTIKQHKYELNQLENEKTEKMSLIKSLENDNQKLNSENKDLSSQLNIKEEYNEKYFLEIQSLTENAKQHKYELDQFENEKTESMCLIKRLEDNYEKLAIENKDLSSKLNIKDEQHEKYSLEIQSLTETLKQKNYELEQLENEKTKFISSIEHLKYEYEKLAVENKDLSSKLKIKEEENEEYSLDIQSLTKTIKQHKYELDKLKNEHTEKMGHIKNLENDYQKLDAENKDLSSQLNIKEEYNEKYLLEIQSLTEIIKQHKYELDQFENEKTDHLSCIDNLKCDYEKLSADHKDVCSKLLIEVEQNEKYSLEIKSLTELVKQHEYELNQFESEKTENINRLEILTENSEKLTSDNKDLSSKLNIKEEQNQTYLTEIKRLEMNNEKLVEELNSIIFERDTCVMNYENLKIDFEEQIKQKEEMCTKLNIEENNNKAYSTKIDLMEKIINKFKLEVAHLRNNVTAVKQYLHTEINEQYNLIQELKNWTSRIEKVHTNLLEEIKTELLQEKTSNQILAQQLSKSILDLDNCKNDLDQMIVEKCKYFDSYEKLEQEHKILMVKLNQANENEVKISEQVVEKDKLIAEYQSELESQKHVLLSKEEHIDQVSEIYKLEKGQKLKDLKSLVDVVQFLKHNIDEIKIFHRKELNEYHNLFIKLKQSLLILTNKIITSEQLVEELNNKIVNEVSLNLTLSNDLKMMQQEIEKHNNYRLENEKHKETIIREKESLQKNYIDLIKTINMYNEQLNKVVNNLKAPKKKSDLEMKDEISYKQFSILSELMSPDKHNSGQKSDEISKLGQQISKINAYIHLYTESETFYLNEIEDLKGELASANNNYFDLTQSIKEQDSENKHEMTVLTKNLHSVIEKYNKLESEHNANVRKSNEYQEEILKLKKTHSEETSRTELEINNFKEKILALEEEISNLKSIINNTTVKHQNETKILEEEVSRSNEEKLALKEESDQVIEEYHKKINNLELDMANCEEALKKNSKTEDEYKSLISNLQVLVVGSKSEIEELRAKMDEMYVEKQTISGQLTDVSEEKKKEILAKKMIQHTLQEQEKINEEFRKELADKNALLKKLETYEELQRKYEELQKDIYNRKFLEEKVVELEQKTETLITSSEMQKMTYNGFKIYYKGFKENLEKIISQKNILETLTSNLRYLIVSVNKNSSFGTHNLKKLLEKKEAMEIISEDIMKQYNRYSRQINDIIFDVVEYFERNCDNLMSTLDIKIDNYLEKYNLEELNDQLSDLSDRTSDALEQMRELQKDVNNLNQVEEDLKTQKENILGASKKINVEVMKEAELKKKNLTLRQKVTLLENSKSNLEKTLKKLREENKKLKEGGKNALVLDNDIHYKMLLQEYITYKGQHEEILTEYKKKLETLQKEYQNHKDNCIRTSTPNGDVHNFSSEVENRLKMDMENLRDAYSNIRMINAKLEEENLHSKQLIEQHKQELGKFSLIKEAYDKLLEENNKLMTDVDTMKYKRGRDRDEFLRLIKKERSDGDARNTKQILDIKADYEAKLEKMKDKMIKFYREEVNKEMNRVKAGQHESSSLVKIVEQLKEQLFEAEQKYQLLEMKQDIFKQNKDQAIHSSMESLSSMKFHDSDIRSLRECPSSTTISTNVRPRSNAGKLMMEFKHPSKVNPSALDGRKLHDDRRVSTLPRTSTLMEEITISKRRSLTVRDSIGQNMQMEDEEEMFNNKYLMDLKQGTCDLPPSADRESRISELAWRNSLVPPHLKSSYPAEMQFCSPGRFKEEDIKVGNIPFDDSSCKLLPGDKPRKKDFGTTSYKKPGPPTPSKNGGRLSLQGNEIHPSREPPSEPKRSTPSRIKALFTGRNSSKSSTEISPPKRRLRIFRK